METIDFGSFPAVGLANIGEFWTGFHESLPPRAADREENHAAAPKCEVAHPRHGAPSAYPVPRLARRKGVVKTYRTSLIGDQSAVFVFSFSLGGSGPPDRPE